VASIVKVAPDTGAPPLTVSPPGIDGAAIGVIEVALVVKVFVVYPAVRAVPTTRMLLPTWLALSARVGDVAPDRFFQMVPDLYCHT
jgi:hypothetical protein